jgi:anion-transporting  ArsA/GET3 family ATPase
MNHLFKPGSIVIVLGPGGVGKTTVTAALGVAAAMGRLETAMITVDPARRLRDALGIGALASRPYRLDKRRLRAAGLNPELSLSVMGLDVKATWDGLVERCVTEAKARRQIFANAFYRNLTERFAGADSYAALELLYDFHERRRFDIEIVDTPPAMHAFDFINAPAHLAQLLDSKTARTVFRWTDSRNRSGLHLTGRAARVIIEQLERVAGIRPLSEIAEFLAATAGAADTLGHRMRATAALLRSPAVRFVLVTTAAEDRLRETEDIAHQIKAEGLRLSLVVINRLTDEQIFETLRTARGGTARLWRDLELLRAEAASARDGSAGSEATIKYLEEYLADQSAAIARVALFRRTLPARTAVAMLPEISGIARELNGVARLAALLDGRQSSRDFVDNAAEAIAKAGARKRASAEDAQRLG